MVQSRADKTRGAGMTDRLRKLYHHEKVFIRDLFSEGFTVDELSLMYDIAEFRINQAIKGLRKPERV